MYKDLGVATPESKMVIKIGLTTQSLMGVVNVNKDLGVVTPESNKIGLITQSLMGSKKCNKRFGSGVTPESN